MNRRWRFVLAVVCVTLLFVVLRRIYFDMYHGPRIDAISRDLDDWFDEDEENGDGDGGSADRVARRTKVLELRRALGVGIDSLPTVRFGSDRRRRRRRSDDDDDDYESRIRQKECLSYGAYVSPDNEYVDCRSYCNVTDGVEYRYYDRLGIFLNGRRGRVGGYCVPTDAAVCNTNTSLSVYGRDGWRCLPQTRAFAGEGGNRIVVCNGSLLDRATGKVWHGHIDSTLEFDSIDELLPSPPYPIDNRFRFVCPPGLRDERDNLYTPAPFDRLFLLSNVCAKLIPHADDTIRPVLVDHSKDDDGGDGGGGDDSYCECGDNAYYAEALGTCVPYGGGSGAAEDDNDFFDDRTMRLTISSSTCWEPWMSLSQARNLPGADRMCGVEHKDAGHGAANVGYVRYYASFFDRAVPSPTAMTSGAVRGDRTAAAVAAVGS